MLTFASQYLSVFLPAAGLVGLAASRIEPESTATGQEVDREREAIRVRNGVRPIVGIEEGFGIERLPGGVYGFSYSPASDSVPLFAKRTLGSFEIHKTAGGAVQVLGYVTASEAEALERGELLDLKLYPEAHQESSRMVALASDRVVRVKGPSRSDGNYLSVSVR